jgi:hypothetical protein
VIFIHAQANRIGRQQNVEADPIVDLGEDDGIDGSLNISSRCGCQPKACRIR